MNNQKQFDQLKRLLEGKLVSKVEPPNAVEAICKFVMEDGSAFRLHATDLGFWIEETVSESISYKSLDTLIRDYGHQTYNLLKTDYILPPAKINIIDDVMTDDNEKIIFFIAPDKTIFSIRENSLSPWEKKIINDPDGREILCEAINMGEQYKCYYSEKFGCPENLCFSVSLES